MFHFFIAIMIVVVLLGYGFGRILLLVGLVVLGLATAVILWSAHVSNSYHADGVDWSKYESGQ